MSDPKKTKRKTAAKKPSAPATDNKPDQTTSLLAEYQKTAEANLAGWQRATADYQNLVKETEKRIKDSSKYATEAFILELLPMVDHFKYAFQGIPEEERDSNWLKGIEHIQTNFIKILEDHGVEMIETVGKKFNPELHEAVEEVEVDGGKSGRVAEELASGFKLNGKLIQPAKVKVIK